MARRKDLPARSRRDHLVFCRQEHAAEWLARPPPPIRPPGLLPRTIKDRLVYWSLAALLIYTVVVMLLGSYTLVRLLGRWDWIIR